MAELRNVVRKQNGGRGASNRGFVRKIGFSFFFVGDATQVFGDRDWSTSRLSQPPPVRNCLYRMWIPCPRNQHAPRHRTFSTSPRRILRGGLLEDSCGWSIVTSILAATRSARLRSHFSHLVWSSLVVSDPVRTFLISPDLLYCPIIVHLVLWTLLSHSAVLVNSKNTLLSRRSDLVNCTNLSSDWHPWSSIVTYQAGTWCCSRHHTALLVARTW